MQLVGDLLGGAHEHGTAPANGHELRHPARGPRALGIQFGERGQRRTVRIRLHVLERGVRIRLGQVHAGPAGEQSEGGVDVHVLLIGREALAGGLGRLGHDHRGVGEDLDRTGIAAVLGGGLAQTGGPRGDLLRGGPGEEHGLRVLGRELQPARGGAGLEQERGALRGGRNQGGRLDVEVLPGMPRAPDLVGIHDDPAGGVRDIGIVRVGGLPQRVDHVHVLIGAVVALVVGQLLAQTQVARRRLLIGGHHVPRDAPVGQRIQGGEAAGQIIGSRVGHGGGHTDSEGGGGPREQRRQDQRIQLGDLHATAQGGVRRPSVDVVQS